jgi:hypothetical protein
MPDLDINDAILTRRYDLNGGFIDVQVWKPEQEPNDGPYLCFYRIGWPHSARTHRGIGIDGFQALEQALQSISVQLYASDAYKAGHLTYLGMRDLRLPHVPGEIPGTEEFQKADLLTFVEESSVLVMPDCRFPYLAHPGDFQKDLAVRLEEIVEQITGNDAARDKLGKTIISLRNDQKYYEKVCQHYGFTPPYSELLCDQSEQD